MSGLKQKAKTEEALRWKGIDRTKKCKECGHEGVEIGFDYCYPCLKEEWKRKDEEIDKWTGAYNELVHKIAKLKEDYKELAKILESNDIAKTLFEKLQEVNAKNEANFALAEDRRERLGQIREHTKELIQILALPNMGDEGRRQKLVAIKAWQIKHNDFVGLLGKEPKIVKATLTKQQKNELENRNKWLKFACECKESFQEYEGIPTPLASCKLTKKSCTYEDCPKWQSCLGKR